MSQVDVDSHQHGTHPECPLPKNINDVISCAIYSHPSAVKEKLGLKSSRSIVDKAAQRPNPTFSSTLTNVDSDSPSTELESSLGFYIDIGDKVAARKVKAKAEETGAALRFEMQQALIKKQTILNLYRLRQIYQEEKLLRKNIATFKKLIFRLNSIKKLTAEMEVSRTLLELAQQSSELEYSALKDEQLEIAHFFHVATGHSLIELEGILPSPYKNWPKIPSKESDNSNSQGQKLLLANSALAQSEVAIEESKSWGNLKVGPSIGFVNQGDESKFKIGIGIAMDLPLLHKNDGARKYALVKAQETEQIKILMKKVDSHERHEQLLKYLEAIKALSRSAIPRTLNRKINDIESLYERGLVSGALLIEALEQKVNYIRHRHQRELAGVKALWSIHYLDGKILEVNL